MNSLEKTLTALALLGLARFQLDLANLLVHPSTWEVECRREMQAEAKRLIAQAKSL